MHQPTRPLSLRAPPSLGAVPSLRGDTAEVLMRVVNHGAACSSSSRDRGATSGSEVAITTHAHVANTAAAETADEWQYVPSAGRDAQTWYNNLKKRSRAANEGTVLLPAAAEGDASPHVSSGCHPSAGASRGSGEEGAASSPANGSGGGFLSLEVAGAGCKLVCDTRLAPTYYMAPDQGYVQYRHDTLLLRPYTVGAGKNCLLEGMMAATGLGIGALEVNAAALDAFMAKVAFNPEHGPSMGVLDNALMEAKSPFRLPLLKELNANRKWTLLLNRTEGVYIVLALVRYTEGPDKGKKGGHFVVYDAWRDLLIIGPGHGVLRVEPADKKDEAAARAFLLQHSSLVSPLRVCKLVVAARRASETAFNTPEHYTEADPPAKHVRA